MYYIKDIFHRNMAERLNEVLETRDGVSVQMLRQYYTAGYLKRDDYRDLQAVLKAKGSAERAPAV